MRRALNWRISTRRLILVDIRIDMGVDIAIDTKITCNSNGYPYRYQGGGISIRRVILINMTHLRYSHRAFSGSAAGIEFDSAGWMDGWMDYSCNYMELIKYLLLPSYFPTATFLPTFLMTIDCGIPTYQPVNQSLTSSPQSGAVRQIIQHETKKKQKKTHTFTQHGNK